MRTTLVSDVNLRGPDDAHQDDLLAFLRAWPTERLVLLGDVVDTWWGYRRAVHVEAVPLLAMLHALTRRGTEVIWVAGNRDRDPGHALRALGVQVQPDWRGEAGGVGVLAVHGDVGGGWSQRLVDALAGGVVTRALARVVGPDTTWQIVRSLGDASHAHNARVDVHLLEQQRAWAQRALGAGVGVVCVGHSHAPGIQDLEGGRLVNLGDWLHHRTFAVLDPEVRLLRWHDGQAVPVEGPPAARDWALR